DRAERIDDSPDEIARKLKIFEERTMPLIEHYREKNVMIETYEVSVDTTAENIYDRLNGKDEIVFNPNYTKSR
ncbi:hypothetical protein ACFL30_03935, partial [Candidatus Latescibacterota bacterium]